MNKNCLFAVLLLLPVSMPAAITIAVSTSAGSNTTILMTPELEPLPTGNRVAFGVFNTDAFVSKNAYFAANGNNLVQLAADFTPLVDVFNRAAIDTDFETSVGANGTFAVDFSFNSLNAGVLGKQLFIWAFQTKDNSANLGGPEFDNVKAFGIFSSSNPIFTIDDDRDAFSEGFGLRDLQVATGNVQEAFVGSFAEGGLALALVPEPAVLGLLMGGLALGLAQMRRRR